MLDKLFDILKKESKVIVLDRQSGDFYVLTKWDEYEKLLGGKKIDVEEKKTEEIAVAKSVPAAINNISEEGDLADEERFFLEPNE